MRVAESSLPAMHAPKGGAEKLICDGKYAPRALDRSFFHVSCEPSLRQDLPASFADALAAATMAVAAATFVDAPVIAASFAVGIA